MLGTTRTFPMQEIHLGLLFLMCQLALRGFEPLTWYFTGSPRQVDKYVGCSMSNLLGYVSKIIQIK